MYVIPHGRPGSWFVVRRHAGLQDRTPARACNIQICLSSSGCIPCQADQAPCQAASLTEIGAQGLLLT